MSVAIFGLDQFIPWGWAHCCLSKNCSIKSGRWLCGRPKVVSAKPWLMATDPFGKTCEESAGRKLGCFHRAHLNSHPPCSLQWSLGLGTDLIWKISERSCPLQLGLLSSDFWFSCTHPVGFYWLPISFGPRGLLILAKGRCRKLNECVNLSEALDSLCYTRKQLTSQLHLMRPSFHFSQATRLAEQPPVA